MHATIQAFRNGQCAMANDNGSVKPRTSNNQSTRQPAIDPALMKSLEWRCIGPYRGGRVVAVAGDPVHSQVFYFCSTGGGGWETNRGGNILGKRLGWLF